ncbi:hypothetical protein RhiJN_05196 [Ceratobasidium sp. AG-Ba]|nr:hypothetical protein RhiJN_05196 [Ceratobasidium sp. AG-Ba]
MTSVPEGTYRIIVQPAGAPLTDMGGQQGSAWRVTPCGDDRITLINQKSGTYAGFNEPPEPNQGVVGTQNPDYSEFRIEDAGQPQTYR